MDLTGLLSEYSGFITVIAVSILAFQGKNLLGEVRKIQDSLHAFDVLSAKTQGTIESNRSRIDHLEARLEREERIIRARFSWFLSAIQYLLTAQANVEGKAAPNFPPFPDDL